MQRTGLASAAPACRASPDLNAAATAPTAAALPAPIIMDRRSRCFEESSRSFLSLRFLDIFEAPLRNELPCGIWRPQDWRRLYGTPGQCQAASRRIREVSPLFRRPDWEWDEFSSPQKRLN